MKREQLMETKRFLTYGLLISLIISLSLCSNNKSVFYSKIKCNDDCIVACDVKYNEETTITVVIEKSELLYKFKEFNLTIDEELILKAIESAEPCSVPEALYNELFSVRVLPQQRIDSLLTLGVGNLLITNNDNVRVLNINSLANMTLMEELYAIKRLFEHNILMKLDCESGYYIEIK